jgi:hypothetical protein
MKIVLFIITLFICSTSIGQVRGEIAKDGRELLTETNFIIEGKVNGRLVYDIAVDIKGNITSIDRVLKKSTIKSTPIDIKVRKHVKEFKFVPGTHYPKFHQGRIIITLVKPKE